MRRVLIVLLVSVAWLLPMAIPAAAAPPLHGSWPVDLYVEDGDLTGACGFTVMVSMQGKLKATLYYDGNGDIVREVDIYPANFYRYSNPVNGRSIGSAMPAVWTIEYADGAAVGSSALVTVTGLQYRIGPGFTLSGTMVLEGQVVEVADGWPYIELDWDTVEFVGNTSASNWEDWASTVCEALA